MVHYQAAFRQLQILGLGDLDIAACCNAIGILHLCRGSIIDSDKAMECLQLALNIYKRILGAQSSQVATCLSNIARVFFSRQDFHTALTLFQEALKIRQASPSPETKVDEAAAMFNIGQTYQKLNQMEPALKHFQQFRELAQPTLGKNHRDIATCIKAMACIHYEAGALDEACTLLEEAVQCTRVHAKDMPFELACLLRDMGCLYSMTQQPEKALQCHLETLELQKKQLTHESDASTNPNIMVTLLHIAQNQKKLGKYSQALKVYRTVYGIQLETFGPESLEVAATLCSIGLMLYLKQELQSSLNYYQEALRVRQEHFQTNNNFDIAATFNSIGLIAFKMNKLDLAKNAFRECIRIRIQLEATDAHRDIVTLYSNLGTVYLANGEDKEAVQMFAESIRLERRTLGETHLGVAVSLQHLAQLHQDRGELELAHEYFKEALEITRGVDESMMANKQRTICTLLNLMGNIHLMKAEVPQMMECFTEASRVCGDTAAQDLVIAGYTFYGISKMHPPAAAIA
jgi:tetratricopeptide (TPR) repeat protein